MEFKVRFCRIVLALSVVYSYVTSDSLQSKFSNKIEEKPQSTANDSPFCSLNDEICCENAYNNFKLNWDTGELLLSGLLENFLQSNCSHFEYECQKRTFAFTEFTQLLYDRFCEYETFKNSCRNGKSRTGDKSFIVDRIPFRHRCINLTKCHLLRTWFCKKSE